MGHSAFNYSGMAINPTISIVMYVATNVKYICLGS